MLKNAYLDAKIGVDPAENEPWKTYADRDTTTVVERSLVEDEKYAAAVWPPEKPVGKVPPRNLLGK